MTFVDVNKIAINTTNQNLKSLGITNAEVLFMKDIDAIDRFTQEKRKFDIIFLDPPYRIGQYQEIISLFIKNDLLSEHAIIVIESDKDIVINESFYKSRRDYKYGDIKVAIVRR